MPVINRNRPATGQEFRLDISNFVGVYGGFDMSFPSERTEWVSAPEGTNWYQAATVTDSPWKATVTATDNAWEMQEP